MDRIERGGRCEQCRPGAEPQRSRIFEDCIQSRNAAEPDDLFQVTKLLGDPEADVGRAGDERRVGKTLLKRIERVEARGRGKEPALVANKEVRIVGEPDERHGALGRRRCEAIDRDSGAGRKPCGQGAGTTQRIFRG